MALRDYDPKNPPLAKLHVFAQLDRDLARFKAGRSRLAWKAFPIREKAPPHKEIGRIEFTTDGGIAFTFNVATPQERSWSISAQNLFNCIETADRLYVTEADKPVMVAKAKKLRDAGKVPRIREAKRKGKK